MKINFNDIAIPDRYKIMSQTIVPRPIAWIVTQNKEGIINIAPFSYFNALSSEPPTLIVSIGHKKDGTPKDTLQNIRNTHKATICLTPPHLLEKMFQSSEALPHNQSEKEKFGIETQIFLNDYPPMIEGVETAYFCDFFQEINIGGKTVPIIMKINTVYLDEKIITNKERWHIEAKAVGRIGKWFATDYEIIKL